MGGYISLYNASTAFSDAELANALADFQSQTSVFGEFWWSWGLAAYLDINGAGMPLVVVDYPGPNDPQNALGYHYIDGNDQPYAVVFAGLCRDYGYSTTGVISHELLEMLADQETDTVDLIDNGDGTGFIVIQEVCDPCEMSLYYEAPNGSIVSDFVFPGWFVPGYPGQVDFLGVIPGPLQLASGGYISYEAVTLGGWQQAFGDQVERAADALRREVAAAGNPRVDVIRQLQVGQEIRQHERTPAAVGGNGGGSGPTGAERRQQPARQNPDITVVKREDVPKVGRELGAQLGGAAPLGGNGKRTGGPKIQPIEARS
jgi:hypothetical protein